jgi:hypothetical protein
MHMHFIVFLLKSILSYQVEKANQCITKIEGEIDQKCNLLNE